MLTKVSESEEKIKCINIPAGHGCAPEHNFSSFKVLFCNIALYQ